MLIPNSFSFDYGNEVDAAHSLLPPPPPNNYCHNYGNDQQIIIMAMKLVLPPLKHTLTLKQTMLKKQQLAIMIIHSQLQIRLRF